MTVEFATDVDLICLNEFAAPRRKLRQAMAKRFPILPKHPERTCWGCDRYCPSTDLACGNGSTRAQHPVELFGADWQTFGLDAPAESAEAPA
jgi:hypothetical protein